MLFFLLRIDIEAELQKLDADEQNQSKDGASGKSTIRQPSKPNLPERVDATGLTDDEKRRRAEKEKDKGNEVSLLLFFQPNSTDGGQRFTSFRVDINDELLLLLLLL